MVFLLLPLQYCAAQFVELKVDIEMDQWSFWFLEDERRPVTRPEERRTGLFPESRMVRCVIGTNTWMMEGGFSSNAKVTYWFTGTNIIEHSVITEETPAAAIERVSEISGLALRSPQVGSQSTTVYASADGNPGRPVRVRELLKTQEKICWLAFCSGSALKSEGRRIPLPSDIWKQYFPTFSGSQDKTKVFEDDLGLPRNIEVFTEKGQLVFQYQVHQATNVLGWNIPLEFYLVQYNPAHWPRTNAWAVHLTAKGKVTVIGPVTKPEIPADIAIAAGNKKSL